MVKKTAKPKISFLIAAYNCEKIITSTIRSAVVACKLKNIKFEIIVVDDFSSDQTYQKLEEFKKRNKYLKIFKNKKNLGFAKSIHKAAKKAKGFKIKILHSSNIEHSSDIKNYIIKSYKYDFVLTNFIDKRNIFRKILSRFCSTCFSLVSGNHIRYFNSSVLCSRLNFLKFYPKGFKGNFFLSVIISKLLILNYSYYEIKVHQKHPKKGSKAVSIVNLFSFLQALLIVFFFRLFKK